LLFQASASKMTKQSETGGNIAPKVAPTTPM